MTICSHQRHLLFEDDSVKQVIGWAWKQIPIHFGFAETDAFDIMPNHLHGVIVIQPNSGSWSIVGAQHAGRLLSTTNRSSSASTPAALSVIIRAFKAAVTRELRLQNLWDDQPFWQRNYYDRVVRDNDELRSIREYIAQNPAAWEHDQENPARATDERHSQRWGWLENPRSS